MTRELLRSKLQVLHLTFCDRISHSAPNILTNLSLFKRFRLTLRVRILKHETGFITLYMSCDICLKALQSKSVSRITHLSISSMLSLNRSHLLMKTDHRTKWVPFIIFSLSTTEKYTLAHMQTTETHINTLITLCSDNDNREPGRLNSSSAFS